MARAVVLASGDNAHLVDALVAGPLAAMKQAPLLLTLGKVLPLSTETEIKRLKVTEAYIIGTADVISAQVETQLKALGVTTITRLGGADRYATAVAVSSTMYAAEEQPLVGITWTADLDDGTPVSARLAVPGGGGTPSVLVAASAMETETAAHVRKG